MPSHRGVIGPRARREPRPAQLERRQRIRDRLAPAELERGAERVPEREPQDAAHHPFPQVIHRSGAYRGGAAEGLW